MNTNHWQRELQQSITDTNELCRVLALPPCSVQSCSVQTDYPLSVPHPFVDLMERGNPNDPLLLQVLPQSEENNTVQGFCKDPLEEIACAQGGSVLNKYVGRTLLLADQACGIHCRFCFRRHFPRRGESLNAEQLIAPIQQDQSIEEVILSGGDPLILDDETLDHLLQSLLRIKHVRRIRIHSRLPIVLPSRLTPELTQILTLPIPVYLVLHINHPNELSRQFLERRELLIKPMVMSQTVLLRRINDNVTTLSDLFRRLIDARILPYYLHQLDRVEGAAHFEVAPERGMEIHARLRECLPGYAVPTYVREVSNKPFKEMIAIDPFRDHAKTI